MKIKSQAMSREPTTFTTSTSPVEVITDLRTNGYDRLMVTLTPATEDLTAIDITGKLDHSQSTGIDLVPNGATDFSTPNWPVLQATSNVYTQSAGSTGWFVIDVSTLASVTVSVTAAGDGTCACAFHLE